MTVSSPIGPPVGTPLASSLQAAGGAGAGAGAGGTPPQATIFDGTDDGIRSQGFNTEIFGPANVETFTMAFTVRADVALASNAVILRYSDQSMQLRYLNSAGKWQVIFGGGTGALDVYCDTSPASGQSGKFLFLIAVDFSGGKTDYTIKINNVLQSCTENAKTTGDFTFADTIRSWGGNTADPPGATWNGALGPMWMLQGTYETDWTKFFTGTDWYDWATHTPVTSLGTPNFYMPADKWLELVLDVIRYIPQYGSGDDIDAGGPVPIFGDPAYGDW